MIRQMFLDYAAPAVATAALGVVGTFTLGHSERISVLETESKNTKQVQEQMLSKLDEINTTTIRIESTLQERERYEQRERERPR